MYADCSDEGAARIVLRPLPVVVGEYHTVSFAYMFFSGVSNFIPLQAPSSTPYSGRINIHASKSLRSGDINHVWTTE